MARIRGLEMLFNLVKVQLRSKFDCLVAALHCLLTNEGLQCTGIGDNIAEDDHPSELLPQGWNSNQEVYTLRYSGSKGKYLVKAVKSGDHILHVNVVLNEITTAAMSVNVDKVIKDDFKNYDTTYMDLEALRDTFKKEIFEKVGETSSSKPNTSKPKHPGERPAQPRMPPNPVPLQNPRNSEDPLRVSRPSFPQVGGQDLDPFGRSQGGMFFDPSGLGVPSRSFEPPFGGPGGLPRGAVPPGARFDPFGPPAGPNWSRPNPDHFRPPDFDDFL